MLAFTNLMAGAVYCYNINCSTTSAVPVCCGSKNPDGGFAASWAAATAACTGATVDTQLCATKAGCKAGTICAGQTITGRDVCADSEVR